MRTDRLWLVGVVLTLALGCGSKSPPDEVPAVRESLAARVKAQTQSPDGGMVAEMVAQSDPAPTITVSKTYTDTTTTTGTATATGTMTLTNSQTATGTKTYTASRRLTGTYTGTRTGTLTSSGTATSTGTATGTATWTGTYRGTGTATGTKTFTATLTGTTTLGATFTITATGTRTNTASKTAVGTRTGTGSKTTTQTYTAPRTVTTSRTSTSTRTGTETATNPCYGTWAFCDNFESGNGSDWNVKQGPVQNFSVVPDGSNVYRESDATASQLYISQAQVGMAWMDSTVEANLKPLSFSSASATVSLWGRYDATWNADCGYYLSLRGDGKAALGKRVAGVNTALGSPVAVPGGIATGTWYDVKLDIQGTTLKAYVNNTQLLTQTDSSCTSGSVGVGSTGASFESDDVRVTAPTTNSCVQGWVGTQCGAFCTYEATVQSDRAGCGAYLDCYATNGCSPETCGGQDDVCGVNVLNPWGTASKEVADQVYKCLGCAGSVNCANPKYYNGTVCADGNPCTWGDTCQNGLCVPDPNRNAQCNAADGCHDVGTCDTTSGKCSSPAKSDGTSCDDGNAQTQGDVCTMGVCQGSQTCSAVTVPSVGGSHSCAVRADGSLWCWGSNADNQLGAGTDTASLAPIRVGDTTWRWSSVTTGEAHTCAIRSDGTLWCWGANQAGHISGQNWNDLKAGSGYTCGLRNDKTLWCWGTNTYGNLGNGSIGDSPTPPPVIGSDWTSVATGSGHACAIQSDHSLWCWGLNVNSQLGDGMNQNSPSPVQIGGTVWTVVAAGGAHTCAVRTDGTLWCWGSNSYGQLGTGTVTTSQSPAQVGTATWLGVSAGHDHTCGIQTGGTLWCWGRNDVGQVGDSSATPRLSPVRVLGQAWAAVAAGSQNTCATRTDGTIWCWGENAHGEVGDGSNLTRRTPEQVVANLCGQVAICGNGQLEAGEACDDGNNISGDGCSSNCQVEKCAGVVCVASGPCHVAGLCDPSTGVCSNPVKPDGTACNDNDPCTQNDSCQQGACMGGLAVGCPAPDPCHGIGTCTPESGGCVYPTKDDGSPCDDGIACTHSDQCQSGTCVGIPGCGPADSCHEAGVCDSVSGTCTSAPKSNGTACDDGNPCTSADTCQAGQCVGSNQTSCDDADACTADACDPVSGCQHQVLATEACIEVAYNMSPPNPSCTGDTHDGGDGTCVPLTQCAPGYHVGGGQFDPTTETFVTVWCIPGAACLAGYHDGGDGATCLPQCDCLPGYWNGGILCECLPPGTCPTGYHFETTGICCITGEHDPGDGMCRKVGTCVTGYHDGGDGSCVSDTPYVAICPLDGSSCTLNPCPGDLCNTAPRCSDNYTYCNVVPNCVPGYHDGGDFQCRANGQCSPGYVFDGVQSCVGSAAYCAYGFHDGGNNTCLAIGTCSSGFHQRGDRTCVADGSATDAFIQIAPATCPSWTAVNWHFAINHDDDDWQQVSENPNVGGDYNNNVDYTSAFVGNAYLDKFGVYISKFDTEKDWDTFRLLDGTVLSGSILAGDVVAGWHDMDLGNGFGVFRFLSDAFDTRPGLALSTARVCTTDSGTPGKAPRILSVATAMRNTGFLLGTGDTIYFQVPVGSSGPWRDEEVHDTFALWGDGTPGVDFDLYARCGALPTADQWDGYRGFSTGANEFIHAQPGTCPSGMHRYVAVHSYNGSGMFNFVAHKHWESEHREVSTWNVMWGTEFSTTTPAPPAPTPLTDSEIDAYVEQIQRGFRLFFGANEGSRYWDRVDFWTKYKSQLSGNGTIWQSNGNPNACVCGQGFDTDWCTFWEGDQVNLYRYWTSSGSPDTDGWDGRALAHEMGHRVNCLVDEYGGGGRLECGHSIMSSEWVSQHNYCYCNDPTVGQHECSQGNGDHGWDTTPTDNSTINTVAVWTRMSDRSPFYITSTPDNYDYHDFDFSGRYAMVNKR